MGDLPVLSNTVFFNHKKSYKVHDQIRIMNYKGFHNCNKNIA